MNMFLKINDLNLKKTFGVSLKDGSSKNLFDKSKLKILPFNTTDFAVDLKQVLGKVLLKAENKKVKPGVTKEDIIESVGKDEDLLAEEEDLPVLKQLISDLYLTLDDNSNQTDITSLEISSYFKSKKEEEVNNKRQKSNKNETSSNDLSENFSNKVSQFIFDIFFRNEKLEKSLEDYKTLSRANYDILEKFYYSHLDLFLDDEKSKTDVYFPIVKNLQSIFVQDFKTLLELDSTSVDDLVQLIDFYYFIYLVQLIRKLRKFGAADRTSIEPIYFSLSWEKVGRSRNCVNFGWKLLENGSQDLFAHSVTLLLLNETEIVNDNHNEENEKYSLDYILLQELLTKEELSLENVIDIIEGLKLRYSRSTKNLEVKADTESDLDPLSNRLFSLFKTVKINNQVKRQSAMNRYNKYFSEKAAKNYVKNRGPLGKVLSINESLFLFLTNLIVSKNSSMRLNDFFKELEKRGIFLDRLSQTAATSYLESLNLIDKKSDSGDAKYVRSLL